MLLDAEYSRRTTLDGRYAHKLAKDYLNAHGSFPSTIKFLTHFLSTNALVLVGVYAIGKILKATSVYTAFDALAGGHVLLAPFLFYLMLLVAAFFVTTQKAWKVRLTPQQVRSNCLLALVLN